MKMVNGITTRNSKSTFQSPQQRSWIILSFLLTFLFCLPISWNLTKITRLNLPSSTINDYSESKEESTCPLKFPIHLILDLDPELIPNQNDFPIQIKSPSEPRDVKVYTDTLDWNRALKSDLREKLERGSDLKGAEAWIDDQEGRACIDWYLSFNHDRDEEEQVENQNTEEMEQKEEMLEELEFNRTEEGQAQEVAPENQVQRERRRRPPPNSIKYHINLITSSAPNLNPSTSTSSSRNLTLSILNTNPSTSSETSNSEYLSLLDLSNSICREISDIFDLPFKRLGCRTLDENIDDDDETIEFYQEQRKKSIVPYANKIKLIFSLINQDSSQFGYKDWEIEKMLPSTSTSASTSSSFERSQPPSPSQSSFSSLISSLSSLHQFKIETQIQYFSPLSFNPTEINLFKREENRKEKLRQEIEKERRRVEEQRENERRWKEDERIRQGWEDERKRIREEVDRKAREEEEKRLEEERRKEEGLREEEVKVEKEEEVKSSDPEEQEGARTEDSNEAKEVEEQVVVSATTVEATQIQDEESSSTDSTPDSESDDSNEASTESTEAEPTPGPGIIIVKPKEEEPNLYSNKSTYLVEWQDLSIFVNSAEWSLTSEFGDTEHFGSFSSNTSSTEEESEEEKVLHFILFIPSNENRPLGIRDPNFNPESNDFDKEREVELSRVATQAWTIPQWGGVMILNPEEQQQSLIGSSNEEILVLENGLKSTLTSENLVQPFDIFSKQLLDLIGLEKNSLDSLTLKVDERLGLELSIENLTRKRILENLRESISTLKSILKLKSKILNLGIGSEVKKDFEESLEILTKLMEESQSEASIDDALLPNEVHQSSTESQDLDLSQVLKLSSRARNLSNRAFFNPNMLGMLYFPDEHKYAVLTPLFGPIAVPILVAVLQEIKKWIKEKKERKKAKKGKKKKE